MLQLLLLACLQSQTPLDAATLARYEAAARYSEETGGFSVLVHQSGRTVFEAYANGADAETPHELMSGTKSFWGVLAMAAIEDERLSLDERIAETIVEWKDDELRSQITVRHLLDLSSGLPSARLRYTLARDRYKTAIGIDADRPAGERFEYGPTNYYVLGELLSRKLEKDGLDPLQYLEQRILEPIGLKAASWKRDKSGNPLLPHGSALTAREWVKFGVFLLARGRVGEQQLIESETLLQCFEPSHANPSYGLTFWLGANAVESLRLSMIENDDRRRRVAERLRKAREGRGANIPKDLWIAAGKGNQRLYVFPSLELVVVRQGEDDSDWSDLEFLELLLSEPALRPGTDSPPR